MNELNIQRTPELIGAEIRTLTTEARYVTLRYGIEIGRRLVEAKEMLAHGEWLNFLETQTEFSQPTASRFIRLFKEYGADQSSLFGAEPKYSTLNNLSISNALQLLAVPENEREQFATDNDLEHKSAREMEQLIKQKQELEARLKAQEQQMQEAEKKHTIALAEAQAERDSAQSELNSADHALKTVRKKLQELENRPVEVAVERDEKAIAEAAAKAKAEAEAAAKTVIKELKDQISEQKTTVDNLNAQLQEAGATDKSALEKQVKQLEAQLKLSTPTVSAFSAAFERIQQEFNLMMSALEKAPEDVQENLKTAAKAVVEGFSARVQSV